MTALDLLVLAGGGVALMALLIGVLFDATWLTLYLMQPLVRGFERLFLGIDAVKAGPETLLGQRATIVKDFQRQDDAPVSKGCVRVDGEVWKARSAANHRELTKGQLVTVEDRDGLTLTVAPAIDD